MPNPRLDAELDDLYGRYSSLSQQIDTLGLTDSYGAAERRGTLDHERKKLWQQFEQYKADRGPEYEDWKQRKVAVPPAPAPTEGAGLGTILKKAGKGALAGAAETISLPARATVSLLGLPDPPSGFTRRLLKGLRTTAEEAPGPELAETIGKGVGSVAPMLLTPSSWWSAPTIAGTALKQGAMAMGLGAAEDVAEDKPLSVGETAARGVGGAALGAGVSWLGRLLSRRGAATAKSPMQAEADTAAGGATASHPVQAEAEVAAGGATTSGARTAPAPPALMLEDQAGRIIYGQPPPLALPAPETATGRGFLASRRLHGRGTPPPEVPAAFRQEEILSAPAPRSPLVERVLGRRKPPIPSAVPRGTPEILPEPQVSATIRPGGRAKAVPKKGEALGAPGAALEGPRPAPPSAVGPVPRGTPPPAVPPPPSLAQVAADELRIPVLNPQIHAKVVNAAAELIKSGRLPADLTGRPTDILAEAARRGLVGGADFEALLTRHGLTRVEFADDFLAPLHSLSGRELGRLSYLQRLMGARGPATEQLGKELQRLGLDTDEGMLGMGWWRRLDNVRRGLLVSQVSTAMRNFETQVGRMGLDVLQAPLDSTLQRTLGLPQTVSPLEGLEQFLTVFRDPKGTTALTEQIFKAFPAQRDRMFMTYSSDILMRAKAAGLPIPGWAQGADAALTKMEGLTTTVNFANRFQEFLVRRGVFQANLAKEMSAKGKDLLEVIGRNAMGEIPEELIQRAVSKALDITFATQPAYGSIAHDFVRAVNRLPGATFALPFPRFLTNAIRFQWEYSPLGILNYLSPTERAAFAAGDTSRMSKVILGTGMLGAAWQFRQSEYAGEKWYEAKLPSGTSIDLRPFNPFASYLFIADTVKRMREGTLSHLNLRDIATGVLSANVRGGTGLYLIDQAINGLATNANTLEKAVRRGKEFGGEVLAGFLTPLKQVNDVLGQFDEEYRIVRERRAEPFLGPIKTAVPGLAHTLPPAVSPTRTGQLERRDPLLKQTTGLLTREPKNAAEAELDRLGFSRQEILKPTGDYEYDRRRTELMGPLVERLLVPLIESPAYQRRSTAERGVILSEQLKRLRHTVTQTAEAMSAPEERQARKLQRKGRWTRALGEERTRGER